MISCFAYTFSLIRSKPRMATNETLNEDKAVPGPLNLPKGKLFMGWTYIPFDVNVNPIKIEPDASQVRKIASILVSTG